MYTNYNEIEYSKVNVGEKQIQISEWIGLRRIKAKRRERERNGNGWKVEQQREIRNHLLRVNMLKCPNALIKGCWVSKAVKQKAKSSAQAARMTADYLVSRCLRVHAHCSAVPLLYVWDVFRLVRGGFPSRAGNDLHNLIKLLSRPFTPSRSKHPACRGTGSLWKGYQIQDALTECMQDRRGKKMF